MDVETYPQRPRFFAHRFCRLMAKVCLANEIGPEACWLLTIIAHTEDAKGYRSSVSYFNYQLLPLIGVCSEDSLDRIRARAVHSGWLHYQRGAKRIPGRYWVKIPSKFDDWDDSPTDENHGDYTRTGAGISAGETDIPAELRVKAEGKCGGKPRESADHSSLTLPLTQEKDNLSSANADTTEENVETFSPSVEEFVEFWNRVVGEPKVRAITGKRLAALRTRSKDPFWREHWRSALQKIPQSSFLRGEKTNWRANVDWFLSPGSVVKIVEGNYDDRPQTGGAAKPRLDREDKILAQISEATADDAPD